MFFQNIAYNKLSLFYLWRAEEEKTVGSENVGILSRLAFSLCLLRILSLSFQDLMNMSYSRPHDPYLRLTDVHWPPYIELLLRCGIAQRHPQDCNLIRLVAFNRVCWLVVPLRRRQISQFVRDKRLSIALQASSQSWLWHVSQSSWCLPQVLDTRERGTLQRQTVVSIFMDMVFTGLGINIVHIFTVFLVDLFDQN